MDSLNLFLLPGVPLEQQGQHMGNRFLNVYSRRTWKLLERVPPGAVGPTVHIIEKLPCSSPNAIGTSVPLEEQGQHRASQLLNTCALSTCIGNSGTTNRARN